MKTFKTLFLAIAVLVSCTLTAQVAISTDGGNADESAMLEVKSTTKGFLPPRMMEAQRDAISSPATGLIIYQTDGNAGLYQYNGTAWAPINETLAIGDNYGGGIIFWLDATGQHGLIAATEDQSTEMQWHNGSNTTTGATLNGVYAGKANTNLIIAKQGAGSYAAQLCADYSIKVNNEYYDDWYLPSKYELNLLYAQKTAVGGFASTYYWSSTEISSSNAWIQTFGTGARFSADKSGTFRVRAIRAF